MWNRVLNSLRFRSNWITCTFSSLWLIHDNQNFSEPAESTKNKEFPDVSTDENVHPYSTSSRKYPNHSPRSVDDEMLDESHHSNVSCVLLAEGWSSVVDKDGLQLYQRPFKNTEKYEYKVFGHLDDYRKQWDSNVQDLHVIGKNSTSDIIVWLHKFPYPMSPRMYLYARKYIIDKEKNKVTIEAKSITPSELSPTELRRFNEIRNRNLDAVFVDVYSSQMIIKSDNSMRDPGFKYILNYYDDPKVSVFMFANDWLSKSCLLEFVKQMRLAALKIANEKSD
ncbi:hypothetical protein GJ496_005117 [Pomphorhynchus laevis]|nr:hypothetical protein GJ496_005117 [Pomphorhynchus laevis]